MSEKLAAAIAEVTRAEDALSRALRKDYPVGADIVWERNGRHGGFVVMHGSGDSIKIKNVMTGNEYWICADDIVRAMP